MDSCRRFFRIRRWSDLDQRAWRLLHPGDLVAAGTSLPAWHSRSFDPVGWSGRSFSRWGGIFGVQFEILEICAGRFLGRWTGTLGISEAEIG